MREGRGGRIGMGEYTGRERRERGRERQSNRHTSQSAAAVAVWE